ncbi:unnamed protein product [Symbiodinium sp. KB8]|nr:unnamed protein product [Symbiodinium sp. KB8]
MAFAKAIGFGASTVSTPGPGRYKIQRIFDPPQLAMQSTRLLADPRQSQHKPKTDWTTVVNVDGLLGQGATAEADKRDLVQEYEIMKQASGHIFKCAVYIGEARTDRMAMQVEAARASAIWKRGGYMLSARNCQDFVESLARHMTCGAERRNIYAAAELDIFAFMQSFQEVLEKSQSSSKLKAVGHSVLGSMKPAGHLTSDLMEAPKIIIGAMEGIVQGETEEERALRDAHVRFVRSRWQELDPELRSAFFAMEARRQQRQAFGRPEDVEEYLQGFPLERDVAHIARGVWSAISEVAMFLGASGCKDCERPVRSFTLYGLAKVRTQLLGPPQKNLRYLALPVVFTVGIMGLSLNRSLSVRDNLPLLWGKTWIAAGGLGTLVVRAALFAMSRSWDRFTLICSKTPGDGFFVESLWREEQIVLGVFLSLEAGAFLALCPGISRDVPAAFPKQEHASHKPESRLHAAAQNSPKNKTTREAVTVAVWTVQKTYPFLALWQQLDFLTLHSSNLPDAPAQGNLLSYPTGTAIFLAGATFNVQDFSQLPHGHGIWQDDSYHGEVYEGSWFRGQPVAPFVSRFLIWVTKMVRHPYKRCFGSGAISCGLKVGYGTARLEELSEVFRLPQRVPWPALDGCFRFGSLGVECSASGAFLAHLPQRVVGQHQSFADASGGSLFDAAFRVEAVMGSGGDDARSAAASFCRLALQNSSAMLFPGDGLHMATHAYTLCYRLRRRRFADGLRVRPRLQLPDGRWARRDGVVQGNKRGAACRRRCLCLVVAGKIMSVMMVMLLLLLLVLVLLLLLVVVVVAVVVVDWACLRLGQLMTLGKFSSRFLPFVFSWPTGTIASFFHVRRHLDQFAGDLAEFLHRLHESGIQEFHLMAHSMGCELVCAALDHLEQLPARGRPATTGGTDELPRAKIATISFCNPSCPLNAFLEGSPSNLARLAALCQRLTFYVDREDTALWAGEVLGGHGRALGRFAEPLPSIYDSSLTPKIDVVDCTSMDANVNGIRHSYFDLNAYLVSDLHELVSKGTPANRRSRLVRTSVSSRSNVFSFLAPPVFVNW